jgi:hypothetical protein
MERHTERAAQEAQEQYFADAQEAQLEEIEALEREACKTQPDHPLCEALGYP